MSSLTIGYNFSEEEISRIVTVFESINERLSQDYLDEKVIICCNLEYEILAHYENYYNSEDTMELIGRSDTSLPDSIS